MESDVKKLGFCTYLIMNISRFNTYSNLDSYYEILFYGTESPWQLDRNFHG